MSKLHNYWKVFPSIAKRIVSVRDLEDFWAYMDDFTDIPTFEDAESYLDNLPTYLFPIKDCDRIDKLTYKINYEVGAYDLDNVKRILGRYYGKEKKLLFVK